MPTLSWKTELDKIKKHPYPGIALNNFVKANIDVALQIPFAQVFAVILSRERPNMTLNGLMWANPKMIKQIPPVEVLEFIECIGYQDHIINGFMRASREVTTYIYVETYQLKFWQKLLDTSIVKTMKEELLTKVSESNATAIALKAIPQQLNFPVSDVVIGITLAYLQYAGVSQKAEEVTNDKALEKIQKTAFNVSKSRL